MLTDSDGTYGYRRMWTSVPSTSVSVLVRTGSNANLLLSNTAQLHAEHEYEITLGASDNTKTVVRRGRHSSAQDNILLEVETKNILNEHELRRFWARWDGGHFEIGSGPHVGEDRIAHWLDEESRGVNALSVCTDGEVGSWVLPSTKGKYVLLPGIRGRVCLMDHDNIIMIGRSICTVLHPYPNIPL